MNALFAMQAEPKTAPPPDWREITSRRREFANAERVWQKVLAPELSRREGAYGRRLVRAVTQTAIYGLIAAVLSYIPLNILLGSRPDVFILAIVIGGAIGGFICAFDWIAFFTARRDNKHLILGAAAASFGFKYDSLHEDLSDLRNHGQLLRRLAKFSLKHHGGLAQLLGHSAQTVTPPTPAYDALKRAGLLPDHFRALFEDMITGERAGVRFSMVEASMDDMRGKRVTNVFTGVLLHIEYPRRILGRTLIARREWWRLRPSSWSLQKVDLNSRALDQSFTVYSDDQVEARTLLTPDRMERLVRLERQFSSGKLRGVFEDGHMTLALEGHDRFEAGSMFGPLVDPRRFTDALTELETICDLIDGFMSREWTHKTHL